MAELEQAVLKALTFSGFEIKDAEKGEVSAKVATLEVVDKDGDIIRKSAQPKAAKVAMSSWGHDAVFGNRPVGKGTLARDGDGLRFDGRVFLNTVDGRETFEVLKEMGPDQQWSFAFRVLGSEVPSDDERKAGAQRIITKMDAFEVSPVLIGAGIGTHTMSVKAQADGDPGNTPELTSIANRIYDKITAELIAGRQAEAEAKAAAEAMQLAAAAKAEEERLAAEAKAAAAAELKAAEERAIVEAVAQRLVDLKAEKEAATIAAERAAVDAIVTREFDRLQRNMRRYGSPA